MRNKWLGFRHQVLVGTFRFWKGFGRSVLRRGPDVGFTVKMGSEKGSQKGF